MADDDLDLDNLPELPPVAERTEEQLRRSFDYAQNELHLIKEGKAQFMSEIAVRAMLEVRLEMGMELHRRGIGEFKGTSPLDNEGIDNAYFEALFAMDKAHFYRLAEAPPILFQGLLWLDLNSSNEAAYNRKFRIMGDIDRLNNAILWVHRVYEYDKQVQKRIEQEAKEARKAKRKQ